MQSAQWYKSRKKSVLGIHNAKAAGGKKLMEIFLPICLFVQSCLRGGDHAAGSNS